MIPLKDNVPTRTFPIVTLGLILANTLVWFWEVRGTSVDQDVAADGYYPCTVSGPCEPVQVDGHVFRPHLPFWESAFTSMFMHGKIFVGLVFIREIPAVWFLGVWIALQVWQEGFGLLRPGQAGGGVAFFAHIGGFAFGALTVYLVAKRRPLRPAY